MPTLTTSEKIALLEKRRSNIVELYAARIQSTWFPDVRARLHVECVERTAAIDAAIERLRGDDE